MKKILSLVCVTSMIFTLAACTKTEKDTDKTGETTASTTSGEATNSEAPKTDGKYKLGEGLTDEMIKDSLLVEGNKVRLANFFKKLETGEEVTVGYIGGSITAGSSASANSCYAYLSHEWIQNAYPDAKVNYINAGIGATGSYIGVHRVQGHLLDKNPDLVFIEFSVNDTHEQTELNKKSYDSLVRKIWGSEKNPAIITIATTQENGTSFQEEHKIITEKYDIPMISYKNAILNVIEKGDIAWTDISDDNIHPNVAGHRVLADLLIDYLDSVKSDLANISGEESDLTEVAVSDALVNGSIIGADATPKSLGGFKLSESTFGGFEGSWNISTPDGKFEGDNGLTFEVEGKNIGVLYGKTVSSGAKADVFVDGEKVATLNSDFSGGWGNYVDFSEVVAFDTEGKHTVEIKPVDQDSKAAFIISGLLVS